MNNRSIWILSVTVAGLMAFAQGAALSAEPASPAGQATGEARPTVFLIGDSTVKNNGGKGTNEALGWGNLIGDHFDQAKINVRNLARGGRSSRTYFSEGIWDEGLADIKRGDFVLMQFGHNDGSPPDREKRRGSLKGIGDETLAVTNAASGKVETVHTYGWYMRKYISDARARGATPIVFSPVPRNDWKEGRVIRASKDFGKWACEAAKAEGAAFVDLNDLVARRYDEFGAEKVRQLFGSDHTHTSPEGARLNAYCVAEGLRGLKDCPLAAYLLPNPKPFVLGDAPAKPGQLESDDKTGPAEAGAEQQSQPK